MKRRAVGFKTLKLAAILTAVVAGAGAAAIPASAKTAQPFTFQKDAQGLVRPFKLQIAPLSEFIEAYSKLTGIRIEAEGPLADEVKGSVTLFVSTPITPEALTDLFHQILWDNGFAAMDGPGGSGWVIQRGRDARDGALPIYESTNFPATYRLMTVVHTVRYVNAEEMARMIRSFMPANSRIIPAYRSKLLITDVGRNIRKSLALINLFDTEDAAKKARAAEKERAGNPACNAGQKIEKLTVENLEVRNISQGSPFTVAPGFPGGPSGPAGSMGPQAPRPHGPANLPPRPAMQGGAK